MLIHCSRKLYDSLAYPVEIPLAEYETLYSWYGLAFYDDEFESYIMLYNEAHALPIVVQVGESDITGSFLLEAIRLALLDQGYDNDLVEKYIREGQRVTFAPSGNQNSLARANRLIDSAFSLDGDIWKAGKTLSEREVTYKKRRIVPSLAMKEALEAESKEILRSLYMVVPLHVTLRLTSRFKVYRDFLVPITITFAEIHEMLQIGFGWDDMHLHVFKIGRHIRIGKPSNFSEMFESGEFVDEHIIHLGDLSSGIKSILYLYDFGDGWEHTIRIGKRKLQAEKPLVLCTGGEGDSPWGDCGGPYGYEEMVDILSDPEHEQYETINDWAGERDLQRFKKNQINYMLERLL